MDRRRYLKVMGSVGVAGVGSYGVYTSLIRDGESDGFTDGPADRDGPGTQTTFDAEPRDGTMLFGLTPTQAGTERLALLERWLEKRPLVVGKFVDIGISDDDIRWYVYSLLETLWNRGHVPHLFWQPFFGSHEGTSANVTREVANGEHDGRIEAWADALADWARNSQVPDRRLYLNLAPEMNGDWSPWSPATGDTTEADFVDMWRHVHDLVTDAGLTGSHVQWIWTIDNTTRDVDVEACYPGDEYVDWTGLHGYNWANWGVWSPPEEVYTEKLDLLRSISDRPIAVTEFGCSSETVDGDYDPSKKSQWITDVFEYFTGADVKMSLWFNSTKETDWAVFGSEYGTDSVSLDGQSYTVYPAYQRAMNEPGVLTAYPDHPRLLTDEEFAGDF
ncbi:glycoside hydrolase family 26 protein [Haloarchaeobius sp. HRN-SO-5]|uniref:glycoside hydrolase family 26 protein n=1 Tax=Haloarchaeobius sp. HRN-SO-5 TaxID=3446118 RepID=UPI003EBCAD31